MDGIPLSLDEIETFYQHRNLKQILDDLANKGYLKYEHPKDIQEVVNKDGKTVKKREYRLDLPKGYNIVVGKLSFPINKILDPHDIAPTLVATDMQRLAVVDGKGLRCLTIREGLRLFGFPEDYHINLPINKAFDLLGNTVVVTVVREISERIVIQKMLSVPNKVYVLTR
jgi:DNA (cytosine-5)-methyltransferase 1